MLKLKRSIQTRLASRGHLEARPVMVILLRNLEEPRDKAKIRKSKCNLHQMFYASHLAFIDCRGIYNEILLTAKDITAALHEKCQLDACINPRFYVKILKAHKYTNQGTKWKLVGTTERLEPKLKELHGVFRADSYTLVLLGRRWIWMRDTTRILGTESTYH